MFKKGGEIEESEVVPVSLHLTFKEVAMFATLQRIGRSLMLPIAVLPAAGILLRFGQADLLNIPWLADAVG